MRGAALAEGVVSEDENCLDPDVMMEMTRNLVKPAYQDGNCGIVERGAQCILRKKTGVFPVFMYAPF